MRRRMRFSVLIVGFMLSAAMAVSERHGRADSVQNYRSTGTENSPSYPRPNWDVRYSSGSFDLKRFEWLKVAFVPEETAHKTLPPASIAADQLRKTSKQAAPLFTVTLDQLRAIYWDPRAEKGSDLLQSTPRSGCGYAKSLMPMANSAPRPGAFIAWATSPGPILRAVEHFNRHRAVRLLWSEGSTDKELVLAVNQCEYASFIANLRRFAGQRWKEIGHQLK